MLNIVVIYETKDFKGLSEVKLLSSHPVPGTKLRIYLCCCACCYHWASVVHSSSGFINCRNQSVFNNVYYPQQLCLSALSLEGCQFWVNLQHSPKLRKNLFKKLNARFKLAHLFHLQITLWLSKLEGKVNCNYIAYQYICISCTLIHMRKLPKL